MNHVRSALASVNADTKLVLKALADTLPDDGQAWGTLSRPLLIGEIAVSMYTMLGHERFVDILYFDGSQVPRALPGFEIDSAGFHALKRPVTSYKGYGEPNPPRCCFFHPNNESLPIRHLRDDIVETASLDKETNLLIPSIEGLVLILLHSGVRRIVPNRINRLLQSITQAQRDTVHAWVVERIHGERLRRYTDFIQQYKL